VNAVPRLSIGVVSTDLPEASVQGDETELGRAD
jgi:hypothetical protein